MASRPGRLVRKDSSVGGLEADSLEAVVERRIGEKFKSVLGNPSHPLCVELWQLGSPFSHRLMSPRCKTERFKCSLVPADIRLYNST
jgi:hypothetical protein